MWYRPLSSSTRRVQAGTRWHWPTANAALVAMIPSNTHASAYSPKPHYGAFRSKDPGQDLSGSLQGAGGIGGLLCAALGGTTSVSSVLYTYCANGNVSELVDTTGTNILAHYEYSPFGKAIVATGPLAEVNAIRFSTKYWDEETGEGSWGYTFLPPGRRALAEP